MTAGGDAHRILIVDDTRSIHDDIRKVLGVFGDSQTDSFDALDAELFGDPTTLPQPQALVCDSAFQGQDALAMVRAAVEEARPYAVAVVDMRMPPGWDGVETIKRIWQVDGNIEVVICTAYSDLTWAEVVGELGRHDNLLILKKPFDPSEVNQMVHALTQNWSLKRGARSYQHDLEVQVEQRTQRLGETSAQLVDEITRRETAEAALRAALDCDCTCRQRSVSSAADGGSRDGDAV